MDLEKSKIWDALKASGWNYVAGKEGDYVRCHLCKKVLRPDLPRFVSPDKKKSYHRYCIAHQKRNE